MFKIPKIPLHKLQNFYLEMSEITSSPLNLAVNVHTTHFTDRTTIDDPSLDQQTILLVRGMGLRLVYCTSYPQSKYQTMIPNQRGVDGPTGRRLPPWFGLSCAWHQFWVLPQQPFDGPWGCFAQTFQAKYDRIGIYHLSHEFYPKRTRKTRWNILRHTRSFQGKPFERHGRSWTFELQTSQNSTHCLYTS